MTSTDGTKPVTTIKLEVLQMNNEETTTAVDEGKEFLKDTSEDHWKRETSENLKTTLCSWIDDSLVPTIHSQEVNNRLYFIIKNIFVDPPDRDSVDQSDLYFSIERVEKSPEQKEDEVVVG
jgi:hypothetical protein